MPRATARRAASRAASLLAIPLAACAASPPDVTPVAEPASLAFAEARRNLRDADRGVPGARDRAIEAAERARALDPEWIAPQRFLDERLREGLLAPAVLDRYREALLRNPDDPRLLYLAGRLEASAGRLRFERAARLDPDLAWAQHGLAWSAFTGRRLREAVRRGERALSLARGSFERSNFTSILARYHVAAEHSERAMRVLEERLDEPDVTSEARAQLGVQLALIELASSDERVRRRGVRRSLGLFEREDLTNTELHELVQTAAALPATLSPGRADLRLALMHVDAPYRELLLGEWMSSERRSRLGLLAFERGAGRGATAFASRVLRFAIEPPQSAVDAWVEQLPARVLDERSLPRDPRLARVVVAARALGPGPPEGADPAAARELGQALIAAGWFDEARALAERVPAGDLDLALDLERRGLAGRALLDGIARLALALDRGDAHFEPTLSADGERAVRSLDDLLVALGPVFARAQTVLGGERDPERMAGDLVSSPRVGYSFLGELVHPGARFSLQDQDLGRGLDGDAVPGLAPALDQLGRFGLFGRFLGGGPPDATILRLLLLEERSGEHLGVPWSGTIAWCEGVDLQGRAARGGASIAGAALHEGYWIDVAILRRELTRWASLRRNFPGTEGAARVDRALALRGLALLGPPPKAGDTRVSERARMDHALGEADRLRLAVMRERALEHGGGPFLVEVTLDDLVDVTATHEEGHLCDRARWYPLAEHFWEVIGFLFSSGFSAQAVRQKLEYRAQLVALCEAEEPRLALVDLLEAAEEGLPGRMPHAAAYRALLQDLLVDLDRSMREDRGAWPELDPGYRLVHQLHHLGRERVRALALERARQEGLVGSER